MGMEVFGIGPLEFLFIFIIILLILGPKDIEKTARNLGKSLNKLYRSQSYQVIRKASEEIRNLPARLAAEAQLDELKEMAEFKEIQNDLNAAVKDINTAAADPMKAWVEEQKAADKEALTPAGGLPAEGVTPPPPAPENSIAPTAARQPMADAVTVTSTFADAPGAPASPNTANEPNS